MEIDDPYVGLVVDDLAVVTEDGYDVIVVGLQTHSHVSVAVVIVVVVAVDVVAVVAKLNQIMKLLFYMIYKVLITKYRFSRTRNF